MTYIFKYRKNPDVEIHCSLSFDRTKLLWRLLLSLVLDKTCFRNFYEETELSRETIESKFADAFYESIPKSTFKKIWGPKIRAGGTFTIDTYSQVYYDKLVRRLSKGRRLSSDETSG